MNDSKDPCSACPLADRRDFLREAAGLAIGVLLGLGLSPARAAALPIRHGTGRRMPGGDDCAYPIPAGDGATIDKKHQVILVRFHDVAYAFALSCPHQNTALRWLPSAGRFQCPKHKSQYQPDGTFITGRATRNMDRLPIRSDGKQLYVDADHVFESDKDAAGWAAAKVPL
ncbi:MAG TPA: Rieske 2Fe-2S domain-containing protein [Gemmatimonadales bacterium]|jgi:Rieske Fe-S protein